MSFPRSPLDLVGDLYLGSLGWTDIVADIRLSNATSGGGLTIVRGKQNEGAQTDAGTTNLTLNNRHGKYSPRNMASPYYGLLGRNTPLRIGVRLARDTFTVAGTNGWPAADTGQPWTAAGTASWYAAAAGFGTHAHPTANVLRSTTLNTTLLDCEQVVTAKSSAAVLGAALVTGFRFRIQSSGGAYYWLRTEFDANSTDIILKISRVSSGGIVTDLAVLDPVPGLSYTAGTLIRSRASLVGNQLAIKAWLASGVEPFDWQLVTTDTTISAPGKVGLQTWVVAGNTNSPTLVASFDNYEVIDRRCHMEVPAWPPRWDLSGNDRWVPLEAAGVLRRLGQGKAPVQSALYRSYANSGALAWWPLEEGTQATSGASGVAGGPPMTAAQIVSQAGIHPGGTIAFGASGDGTGAAALINTAGGGPLSAPIPPSAETSWRFDCSALCVGDPSPLGSVIPLTWFGGLTPGGRPYEFDLLFTDTFARFVGGDPDLGGGIQLTINIDPYDGLLHHYAVELYQSGADVAAFFSRDGVQYDAATWSAMTLPKLSGITFNYYGHSGVGMPLMGHPAVFAPAVDAVNCAQGLAASGNLGETAATRFRRLSTERGVPASIWGDPATSAPMGVQKPAAFLDLLKDCVDADLGLYYEARDRIGLVYRVHRTLQNQTALSLNYAAGHIAAPFEPVPDDQGVINDVSVTREGGATFQSVQEDGPLSVLPPDEGGIGRYDQGRTIKVLLDRQAADVAGWERHRGTWDEERYPKIKVDLATAAYAADPDLAAQVAALDPGALIAITSLPVELPPGGTEQLIQGSTETLDAYDRTIGWNASPGGPYRVATVDGPMRVPAIGSTLGTAINSTAVSLKLTSTAANGIWRVGTTVTRPDLYPMQLRIGGWFTGGELVTATGISGSTSPQTVTLSSRGDEGVARAWPAGTPIQVARPAIVGK